MCIRDSSDPQFINNQRDNHAQRYRILHPFLTEDGGLIFHSERSSLVKIDKDSQLVWQNQENAFHHSIEKDFEGNFWVPSQIFPYQVEYFGSSDGKYIDDAVTKISENGEILFQKSIANLLIENDMIHKVFGYGTAKDVIHLNDIQPVLTDGQFWKRGDIFLSLRRQSMIILYRPLTNKIIWIGEGKTLHQHDVNILDNHRISIFNNNAIQHRSFGYLKIGFSQVLVYDFINDSYSKYLDAALVKNNVTTLTEGRSTILDNGDLFIEEQNHSRLLYFNKDGTIKWEYVSPTSNDGNNFILNWSRIFFKEEDINKIDNILQSH